MKGCIFPSSLKRFNALKLLTESWYFVKPKECIYEEAEPSCFELKYSIISIKNQKKSTAWSELSGIYGLQLD